LRVIVLGDVGVRMRVRLRCIVIVVLDVIVFGAVDVWVLMRICVVVVVVCDIGVISIRIFVCVVNIIVTNALIAIGAHAHVDVIDCRSLWRAHRHARRGRWCWRAVRTHQIRRAPTNSITYRVALGVGVGVGFGVGFGVGDAVGSATLLLDTRVVTQTNTHTHTHARARAHVTPPATNTHVVNPSERSTYVASKSALSESRIALSTAGGGGVGRVGAITTRRTDGCGVGALFRAITRLGAAVGALSVR
jgi:hypothetical protein